MTEHAYAHISCKQIKPAKNHPPSPLCNSCDQKAMYACKFACMKCGVMAKGIEDVDGDIRLTPHDNCTEMPDTIQAAQRAIAAIDWYMAFKSEHIKQI